MNGPPQKLRTEFTYLIVLTVTLATHCHENDVVNPTVSRENDNEVRDRRDHRPHHRQAAARWASTAASTAALPGPSLDCRSVV